MDARSKPAKNRPKRAGSAARVRKPVHARLPDRALLRKLTDELRRNDENAERLWLVMEAALAKRRGPTIAEVMDAGADISGAEFDSAFEEIERLRHDPVMQKAREVDL